MSDEIIRRLRSRDAQSLRALKESLPLKGISEADEDEEEEKVIEPEEDEATVDTSDEEMPDDVDNEPEDDSGPPMRGSSSGSRSTPSFDDVDTEDDTEEEQEVDTPEEDSVPDPEYMNPLDNMYAVKYKIGQSVAMTYSNGTRTKLSGTIDGYDKEGFYRIRWSNGETTNGITDIALSELVDQTNEDKCICGGEDIVQEGKYLVCDKCGRRIRESSDPLTIADKSRPEKKKLVRSEAHPTSTTIKPNILEGCSSKKTIADSIRMAFQPKKLDERDESRNLKYLARELDGQFWTRMSELVDDIENLGYEVIDYNSEYVIVYYEDEEGDAGELQIPIGGTSRTMTLDFSRARFFVERDDDDEDDYEDEE